MKNFRKIMAWLLVLCMLLGAAPMHVLAQSELPERITHPENGPGDVDGMLPYDVLGEDINRMQSYPWSMVEYGDYVYVGSCWNPISGIYYRNLRDGMMAQLREQNPAMPYMEMMEKASAYAQAFVDFLYNGDFPDGDAATHGTPIIVKIHKTSNDVELVYLKEQESPYYSWSGYRNAVEYEGKLYFTQYGNPVSQLLQLDPETEEIKVVLQRTNEVRGEASGIRGLFVQDGQLIVSITTDGSDPDAMNPNERLTEAHREAVIAIGATDTRYNDPNWSLPGVRILSTNDPESVDAWKVIADQNTFDDMPAYMLNEAINGGGIWDIQEYNGSMYVVLVTGRTDQVTMEHTKQGFALVRGDKNEDGSWDWTQIVGDTSKGAKYEFGMGNPWSPTANIYVYNNYLYIGNYNDPMLDFAAAANQRDYSRVYNDLKNPVSLHRMNLNEDIETIVNDGFGAPTNQYVWRMEEHEGKLYVGTFDASTLLSGKTQLTDGTWLNLSMEEFVSRVNYLLAFLEAWQDTGTMPGLPGTDEAEEDVAEAVEEVVTEEAVSEEAVTEDTEAAEPDATEEVTEAVETEATEEEAEEVTEEETEAAAAVEEVIVEEVTEAEVLVEEETEAVETEEVANEAADETEDATEAVIEEVTEAITEPVTEAPVAVTRTARNVTEAPASEVAQAEEVTEAVVTEASETEAAETEETEETEAVEEEMDAPVEELEVLQNGLASIVGYVDAQTAPMARMARSAHNPFAEKDPVEYYRYLQHHYVLIRPYIEQFAPDALPMFESFFNNPDIEGVFYYLAISYYVGTAEKGADLFVFDGDSTEYQVITRDGFGDKYNHGIRTLDSTPEGLYIGMANPFYGTQIWRIASQTEPEVTEPEVTEPEVTEPEVTEPEVTEPEVTEPEATEPETEKTEKDKTEAPVKTEKPKTEKTASSNPTTGDAGVLLPLLTAGAGILGLAALELKRKRK